MKTITTVKELRRAIRWAKFVYVTPRFGVAEREVHITKAEALRFVASLAADATPRDMEMYGEGFATANNDGTLSLG